MLLRILTENLGEASGLQPLAPRPEPGLPLRTSGSPAPGRTPQGGHPPRRAAVAQEVQGGLAGNLRLLVRSLAPVECP